jgi:sterol desaturase/sphingolipid hydroxylase (fatty acid hydroxylase superfamily)
MQTILIAGTSSGYTARRLLNKSASKGALIMDLLLAFAPFIVFAVSVTTLGSISALLIGALASAVVIAHGRLTGKSPKLLEVGALALFAGLAAFAFWTGDELFLVAAKFWVDLGLFLIVILSIVIGRPFTIQYAKESVAPELWSSPAFIRKNYVISTAWAAAFLAMVIAELAMLLWPDLPHQLPVLVIVLALVAAFKFTAHHRKAGSHTPIPGG